MGVGDNRIGKEETRLELAVDDSRRWVLSINGPDYFLFERESPPNWSLRLFLNLSRTFARLPGRSVASELDANNGEVA